LAQIIKEQQKIIESQGTEIKKLEDQVGLLMSKKDN
jgi:hypothetical protein